MKKEKFKYSCFFDWLIVNYFRKPFTQVYASYKTNEGEFTGKELRVIYKKEKQKYEN